MKRYRVYIDVDAETKNKAVRKGLDTINRLNVELCELNYTDSEMIIIKELARVALADAEIFDEMAEELDIKDDTLKALQEKIEKDMQERA